jgi:transcriptional regulator with XRE-family HTH domain
MLVAALLNLKMADSIHNRLKKILEKENISISKFERIIGVGQNSVSTCLRRESSISHNVLQGICLHFPDYSIEWILTGKETSNKEAKNKIKDLLDKIKQELKNVS